MKKIFNLIKNFFSSLFVLLFFIYVISLFSSNIDVPNLLKSAAKDAATDVVDVFIDIKNYIKEQHPEQDTIKIQQIDSVYFENLMLK